LFLLVFVLINFGLKGIWWAVLFLCTVSVTDMTGTYLFKHVFLRLRPCNNPDLRDYVRLLVPECGGGYSFISNHAANHFGMATFFFVTFRHMFGIRASLIFLWASLIAFSQVYVGLHFPADVAAGAFIGSLIGLCTGTLYNKRFGLVNFGNQRNY
jgi:undecaprenyl-diphosphatase